MCTRVYISLNSITSFINCQEFWIRPLSPGFSKMTEEEKEQTNLNKYRASKMGESFGFSIGPKQVLAVAIDGEIIYKGSFDDYMQGACYIRKSTKA